jgi:hypothetical protein
MADDRVAWEECQNMRKSNSFSPRRYRTITPEVYRSFPFQAGPRTAELAMSPEALSRLPLYDESGENECRFHRTASPTFIPSLGESETSGDDSDPDKSYDFHYGRQNDWNYPPSSMEIGQNHRFLATTGLDFAGIRQYAPNIDHSRYFRSEIDLSNPHFHRSESHEGQVSEYHGVYEHDARSYPPGSLFSHCPRLVSPHYGDIPREDISTHQRSGEPPRKTPPPRLIEMSPGVEVVLRGADEVTSYERRTTVRNRTCFLPVICVDFLDRRGRPFTSTSSYLPRASLAVTIFFVSPTPNMSSVRIVRQLVHY